MMAVVLNVLVKVTTHAENLEKSMNLTLVTEKSGRLGIVGEIVVCL